MTDGELHQVLGRVLAEMAACDRNERITLIVSLLMDVLCTAPNPSLMQQGRAYFDALVTRSMTAVLSGGIEGVGLRLQ